MSTSDTFISHLIELRDRLLHIVAGVVLTFVCLFPFANEIYSLLAHPLLQKLPQGGQMIATAVTNNRHARLVSVLVGLGLVGYATVKTVYAFFATTGFGLWVVIAASLGALLLPLLQRRER